MQKKCDYKLNDQLENLLCMGYLFPYIIPYHFHIRNVFYQLKFTGGYNMINLVFGIRATVVRLIKNKHLLDFYWGLKLFILPLCKFWNTIAASYIYGRIFNVASNLI